jgi:hypothetical protein
MLTCIKRIAAYRVVICGDEIIEIGLNQLFVSIRVIIRIEILIIQTGKVLGGV